MLCGIDLIDPGARLRQHGIEPVMVEPHQGPMLSGRLALVTFLIGS